MRLYHGFIILMLLFLIGEPAATSENVLVGDAVADFSITANPNGRWTYGYTTNLGGALIPHATAQPDFFPGVDRWSSPAVEPNIGVMHNKTASTLVPGTYSLPPDMLHMHPGQGGLYDVVRWIAPMSGTFLIQGAFAGLDAVTSVADTDVHVRRNSGTDLYSTVLYGSGTQGPFSMTTTLTSGDTIDFIVGVGPSGSHSNDSTGLKVTITALTSGPTLSDDFNSGILDPTKWQVEGPPATGSAGTVSLVNQRLEMTVASGAGGAGIDSVCQLAGDFDVQVDYTLLNWPTNNHRSVQFRALDLGSGPYGSPGPFRFGGPEIYGMVLVGNYFQTSTTDLAGKLRLTRAGSTLAGYSFNGSSWVLLGSGGGGTNPTRIAFEFGGNDLSSPAGVRVAFDNVQMNSGTLVCPAPSLSVDKQFLSFTYQEGVAGPVPPESVLVRTSGTGNVGFSVTTTTVPSGGNWLSATPPTGNTPQIISVSVVAGLSAGVHSGQLTIASTTIPKSQVNIPVTVTVDAPPQVPAISLLNPSTGKAGTPFFIIGQNFGETQGISIVKVGSQVAPVQSWSNTSVLAVVPSSIVQNNNYAVTVITAAGSSNSQSFFVTAQHNPVILIPGTMGSQLSRSDTGNANQVLWIDRFNLVNQFCDEFLLPLALSLDGRSPASPFSYPCSISTGTFSFNAAGATLESRQILSGTFLDFYSDLIDTLRGDQRTVDVFPYDWRLDFRANAVKLRDLIERVTAATGSPTVDVIAHSQGGLVARTYTRLYATDHRIDTIIYLGTPHRGAAKTFAILGGWASYEEIFGPLVKYLNFNTAVYFSQNFPSLHEMLPRYNFFSTADQLESFRSTYIRLPNQDLVSQANSLWDDVLQSTNVVRRSFGINGSGQRTMLGVNTLLDGCWTPTVDPFGDGTVPYTSGNGLNGTAYYYVNASHTDLPNNALVRTKVIEILSGNTPTLVSGFQTQPFSVARYAKVYTCSPVTMQTIDSDGNITGFEGPGQLRIDVSGNKFFRFGHNEAAIVSVDKPLQTVLKATDYGTFSFVVEISAGTTVVKTDSFRDVPISINSQAFVSWDGSGTQELHLDTDGDGRVDYVVTPNLPPPVRSYIGALSACVRSLNLPKGTNTDLLATADSAERSAERGEFSSTRRQLDAFQNKVGALSGKGLSQDQVLILLRQSAIAIRALP